MMGKEANQHVIPDYDKVLGPSEKNCRSETHKMA